MPNLSVSRALAGPKPVKASDFYKLLKKEHLHHWGRYFQQSFAHMCAIDIPKMQIQ